MLCIRSRCKGLSKSITPELSEIEENESDSNSMTFSMPPRYHFGKNFLSYTKSSKLSFHLYKQVCTACHDQQASTSSVISTVMEIPKSGSEYQPQFKLPDSH